jgi:oligo-1,6-glucosidase
MRATPYIYNGDEIGMVNTNHTNIENYQDVYTINYYNGLKQKGEDYEGFLKSHAKISRDNARTPMQWNSSKQAGFTDSIPWLAVNENYTNLNVASQEQEPDSVLNYFRKMIHLRKNNLILIYGAFELVDENNSQLFAYTRQLNNEQLLVVLNFSDSPAKLNTEIQINNSPLLISNYAIPIQNNVFEPYAAAIYKIK